MLWQFFSLPGIENGIEYRYFSRYRIEVRNSSIVTTLAHALYYFDNTFKIYNSITKYVAAKTFSTLKIITIINNWVNKKKR